MHPSSVLKLILFNGFTNNLSKDGEDMAIKFVYDGRTRKLLMEVFTILLLSKKEETFA